MKFLKISKSALFILLLTFSTNAFAQTHGDQPVVENSAFLDVLNGIDTIPTKANLVAAFPKAALRLEQTGCDPKTKAYARNRAISFLSMFENEGMNALNRLTQCAIPETQERAVYALARAFPKNKKVIQIVLNFNHLESKTTAFWSIRALRWISLTDAKPKLLEIIESDQKNAVKIAKRILKK